MLSDEEIVSLNRMKLFCRSSDLSVVTAKDMDIVVKLVEKQAKEIEQLDNENIRIRATLSEVNKKWEDKIKAKIEEYEKKYSDEFWWNEYTKEVLQSLLDKE